MAAGDYVQGMILDLSRNFTNQDTSVYSVISKPASVPNALIEGVLLYSRKTRRIYQFGGWFSFNNIADPGFITDSQLPDPLIWEFNIDSKMWNLPKLLYSDKEKPDRPGAAAYCDAPSLNKSFIFEGYAQRRSGSQYNEYLNYTVSSQFKFFEGMLQLDTNTNIPTITNISVPDYIGPRMNGAMLHVPVGEQGIIVQIGGQTRNHTPTGVPIVDANSGPINIMNDFIDIYDVKTGFWFRQAAFGGPDIPTGKTDICTILVTAPDNSSYNIFMISGLGVYNTVIAYEDMWVLTLPTFQWVKVYSRPKGMYGQTCHAVGENLVVVGGMQSTDAGGNVKNCSGHMPADIFNLAQMEYSSIFDYAGASRVPPVPAKVVSLIGGGPTGGAVVSSPNFWSDPYLKYVFDPKLVRPAYTPTYTLANTTKVNTASATSENSTSTTPTSQVTPNPSQSATAAAASPFGMIFGASVGGLIALALIVTACIIFFKRHAARTAATTESAAMPTASELPGYEYKDPHAVEALLSYQGLPHEMAGAAQVPQEIAGTPHVLPPQEMDAQPRIGQYVLIPGST